MRLDFAVGSLSCIKSVSQRGLAAYWDRVSAARPYPSFDEFDPGPRLHDPKQLVVWKVEDGPRRNFRALSVGGLVREAFNTNWTGKTLEEVTPPLLLLPVMSASQEWADAGCAVYTVLRTEDGSGQFIDFERLLLPFGRANRVEQIVASLQLVSVKGSFERRNVAQNFNARCDCVFAVRIASRLNPKSSSVVAAPPEAATLTTQVVEID